MLDNLAKLRISSVPPIRRTIARPISAMTNPSRIPRRPRRLVSLAPGWFRTEQNKVLYENQEWLEYLKDRIPLRRPGKPDDLDGAVVFLASEESRYITGQTLLVDGGISTGATRATVAKKA